MEAPAVLYHYASLDTLALILHNRTIRFSRLDKVDDPQEQRSADSQNLGKMKLVSCWTSSDEESIPMWREYAGAECGVRIQMKSHPFKRYSVSTESLSKLSSDAVLNTPGDKFDGLQLPLEDFWDKKYHFKEMARSVEMLHEVQYTNDKSLLFPKLIRNCENGWIEADLNTLGIHKATAWSYQNEWLLLGDANAKEKAPNIKAIYLGENVSDENKAKMKDFTSKRDIPLFIRDTAQYEG